MENMDKQNIIDYWLTTAHHDLETAESLFQSGRYDWCLYVGHLILEKALKAYVVKTTAEVPPKTHQLLYLAEKSGLTLSDTQKIFLERVTDFNLEARYPDYKLSFYKLCTAEFAKQNFDEIKEFYQWIIAQI